MSKKPSDMTRSLDLTHEKRIGAAQRMRRPIYVDLLPPCNHACPAGENIQAWLAAAQAGKFKNGGKEVHAGDRHAANAAGPDALLAANDVPVKVLCL